jgi:hypothetical protein
MFSKYVAVNADRRLGGLIIGYLHREYTYDKDTFMSMIRTHFHEVKGDPNSMESISSVLNILRRIYGERKTYKEGKYPLDKAIDFLMKALERGEGRAFFDHLWTMLVGTVLYMVPYYNDCYDKNAIDIDSSLERFWDADMVESTMTTPYDLIIQNGLCGDYCS